MEALVPKNILDAVFAKKMGYKKQSPQNKSDSANQSILSLLQGKNSNIQQQINLMQNTPSQSPTARLNKNQGSRQQSGTIDTAPSPKNNMSIVEEKGADQQSKKSSLRLIKTKATETTDTHKTDESTTSIPKDTKNVVENQLLAKLAKSK